MITLDRYLPQPRGSGSDNLQYRTQHKNGRGIEKLHAGKRIDYGFILPLRRNQPCINSCARIAPVSSLHIPVNITV